MILIIIVALVGICSIIVVAASAHGSSAQRCAHHRNLHRCLKKKQHRATAKPTELIVNIVGDGGPPHTTPPELAGEIVVYDADGNMVAERSTDQGEVVVRVSPGRYKLTASIGQSAPCQEKEVAVAEKQQEKVTLGCVIN